MSNITVNPTSEGGTQSEVKVSLEDQQKINKFAQTNNKLVDLRSDLADTKREMDTLKDAGESLEELALLDEDATIPFQIGDSFFVLTPDKALEKLEVAKVDLSNLIKDNEKKSNECKEILSQLKAQLYAKFGDQINLEAEEN